MSDDSWESSKVGNLLNWGAYRILKKIEKEVLVTERLRLSDHLRSKSIKIEPIKLKDIQSK